MQRSQYVIYAIRVGINHHDYGTILKIFASVAFNQRCIMLDNKVIIIVDFSSFEIREIFDFAILESTTDKILSDESFVSNIFA